MAKCTLHIELPADQDFVEPGGKLDVIVHVTCDGRVKCNGLKLESFWRTHGKGNRTTGDKKAEELFRGEWDAGTFAYPATIIFPEEPISYHGKVINVDWYLKASADVPLAFDPKDEVMVLMVDPKPPRPCAPPKVWAPRPVKMKASMGGCLIPAYLGLAGALFLFTTPYVLAAGVLGFASIWALMGARKARAAIESIGHVAIESYPGEVAPGETLHALVELQTESHVELEHVRFILKAVEKATSGSGTNTTTYTEEAFLLQKTVATNVHLDPTQRLTYEASFELPVMAPPSLRVTSNEIMTTLTVSIQPTGKAELTFTEIVRVVSHSNGSA